MKSLFGTDGILTAPQVLKLMRPRRATLAELARCTEEYPRKHASLNVKTRKPIESLPTLSRVMAQGARDLGRTGRIVVRYSGTENKVRLLVGSRDASAVREDMGV
jgi:phosphoglucosamine mutase